MKLIPLAVFVGMSLLVRGGEIQAPLKGGQSPNGLLEVRLVGDRNLDPAEGAYVFGFFKKGQIKPFYRAEVGGGYCYFDGASSIDTCSWSSKSDWVAIADHGTRHSMETYLFRIRKDQVQQVPLPEFGKLAKAAMTNPNSGAGSAWVVTPKKWIGDNLILKLETYDTHSEITLRVSDSPLSVQVINESKPISNGEH